MPLTRRTLLERLAAAAAASMIAPHTTAASRSSGPVRLHRNENAYGPSPAAAAAIRDAATTVASRYPDAEVESLRRKIADRHAVAPEQVVLGCGSSEILRMAVEAFAGRAKKVIAASPTYDGIAVQARRAAADVVGVPLRRDYAHDLPAMRASADTAGGLIYICNPNNPTGTLTRRQELESLLHSVPPTVYVVIDEAYHHYVGESPDYASFIDRPVSDDRVIVTRSFSKVHGLAGVRVGYAIAARDTARALASRQLGDSVSAVAARAAAAALDDTEHVRMSVNRNIDDRQEFVNQAISRMLRPVDSQANFFMVNTGGPAREVVEHCATHGILVGGPFDTAIRVSLGTPDDMRAFWRAWDLMPGRGHSHTTAMA
jgi:histidinol-phosphate aminotransferase